MRIQYLLETLKIAIGIAGGLAAVSLIFHIINAIISYAFKKRTEKSN